MRGYWRATAASSLVDHRLQIRRASQAAPSVLLRRHAGLGGSDGLLQRRQVPWSRASSARWHVDGAVAAATHERRGGLLLDEPVEARALCSGHLLRAAATSVAQRGHRPPGR
jgi:hypothetical protein